MRHFRFRTLVLLVTLAALAIPPTAQATPAAVCSRCKTGCYAQFVTDLDQCSWNIWCQDLAESEKNACLGGCVTDAC